MECVYTRVLSACPLLGGLSSFGVSFIGDFTVSILSHYSPPRDVVGERDSQNEDDGVTPTDLPAAERDETPPNSRSRDNLGDGASQDEMDAAVMRPCQAGGRRHTGVPPPPQHNDQVHLMVPGTLASIQSQDSATSLASGAIQTSDSTTALLGNSTVQPTTATPAVAQSDNYPTTISAQPTTSTT